MAGIAQLGELELSLGSIVLAALWCPSGPAIASLLSELDQPLPATACWASVPVLHRIIMLSNAPGKRCCMFCKTSVTSGHSSRASWALEQLSRANDTEGRHALITPLFSTSSLYNIAHFAGVIPL
jgi:hypothetical protein